MKPYARNKTNPFGNTSAVEAHEPSDLSAPEVDQAIYGKLDIPDSGRQIARPIELSLIYPDLRQPRRAIPANFRGRWNGQPSGIPGLLKAWHSETNMRWQVDVDLTKLLRGMGEGVEQYAAEDVAALDYLDLVGLAASIYKEGLTNPITVVRRSVGDSYLLVAGERRLLAHWLLATYVDDKFARIPARVVDSFDVWAQASENGARKPLNAIGMARQLALLIMDMYQGDDGVKFDAYETLILPGECDRPFYAQVANGEIWRIKKGMGQRICDVTGLKSKSQIQQYRGLLNIPDELWNEADLNNWAEGRIRELIQSIRAMPDRSTIVDLSPKDPITGVMGSAEKHAAPIPAAPIPAAPIPAAPIPAAPIPAAPAPLLSAPGAWMRFWGAWRNGQSKDILLVEQNGVHIAFANDAARLHKITGIYPYTHSQGENAAHVLKVGGGVLEWLDGNKMRYAVMPLSRVEGAVHQLYQMAMRCAAPLHLDMPAPVTAEDAEAPYITPEQKPALTHIYSSLYAMAERMPGTEQIMTALEKLHQQIPEVATQAITSAEAARVLNRQLDLWRGFVNVFLLGIQEDIDKHVAAVKAATKQEGE